MADLRDQYALYDAEIRAQVLAEVDAALRNFNAIMTYPAYRQFPYPWPVYVQRAWCELLAEYVGWTVGAPPFDAEPKDKP